LELFSVNLDQLHFVGGTEPDIGALPSVDEADDSLHERAQISRRAMVHLQHNSSVAIVFDGHSSAKIVGGRHGSVQAFKRSADVCTCSAATQLSWGAHASRVLVAVSRRNNLSYAAPWD